MRNLKFRLALEQIMQLCTFICTKRILTPNALQNTASMCAQWRTHYWVFITFTISQTERGLARTRRVLDLKTEESVPRQGKAWNKLKGKLGGNERIAT